MKNTLLLLLIYSSTIGQTIIIQKPVSKFQRDGKTWISYDQKDAPIQDFFPMEQVYECHGNFLKNITDTVFSKGVYTIYLDTTWIKVKAVDRFGKRDFSEHLMFLFMACCFDDKFIYCQCGERFPFINSNVKK